LFEEEAKAGKKYNYNDPKSAALGKICVQLADVLDLTEKALSAQTV
jgi:hypothetical protein